jgi:hypothetical protein
MRLPRLLRIALRCSAPTPKERTWGDTPSVSFCTSLRRCSGHALRLAQDMPRRCARWNRVILLGIFIGSCCPARGMCPRNDGLLCHRRGAQGIRGTQGAFRRRERLPRPRLPAMAPMLLSRCERSEAILEGTARPSRRTVLAAASQLHVMSNEDAPYARDCFASPAGDGSMK